ncbi:HI0074 family nucleotidyltransferase substrate-binding subunit [Thiohalocapsa halophila]|uniref:HI0074 family nucleotidyltransferase substrate-binding subunit n=1 Tax=Thiohalocapsa halophila TaxID=69359 RepID=UPI001903BAFC|nr:HI0074 family nucleotidyltransferase substrate-binding subunit [Thiohalocapsa halophila]
MDPQRLNERIADFLKGVHQLERAVAQPFDEFVRDAVIQRFKFCYELAWKMLKLRLEQEGIDAHTPRQALREALQAGLLDDGNLWSEIQRYRNLTSHTYDERLAEEVYAFIVEKALLRFQALAREAEAWQIP